MYRLFVLLLCLCISLPAFAEPDAAAAPAAKPAAEPNLNDVLAAIRTLQGPAAPPQPVIMAQPQPVYAPPAYSYYYAPQAQAALQPVNSQYVCTPPAPAAPPAEPLSDEAKGAIKQKVTACWIPAYVSHAPAIDMTLSFKEDGSIADAKLSDDQMEQYNKDMLFKSLVNSLRRAAFNPRCMPGKDLPKDGYESWKEVALTFDVKDAPR